MCVCVSPTAQDAFTCMHIVITIQKSCSWMLHKCLTVDSEVSLKSGSAQWVT